MPSSDHKGIDAWSNLENGWRAGCSVPLGFAAPDPPRAAVRHCIRRSALGRLTIRSDGGPCYPQMVDDLESAFRRFGHLVGRGEALTGPEWIDRIAASGQPASVRELDAIRTLLHAD